MIEKLLALLTSSSSVGIYAACIGVGAFGGWYLTSAHYEAKIESIRSELLAQSKKEIDDYASRLSETTNALVLANSRLSAVSSRNDMLARRLLNANNRESERAKAYSEDVTRIKYTECRRLLSEGNDLLREGSDLVGKTAVKHDALANLVK